ncbi:MAG: class I SAM-dependent methyltransferase [Gemmatimonadetes bacterium]|nr:class I SAM-dependent methyltransferase [Gemmatimonadota bacterium]
MGDWFQKWFGEEYLQLYPHRDGLDAEEMVALIERTLPDQPPGRVLDICCGAGRHALAFRDRGFGPIGADLSAHLLERAREVAHVPLVRADLRALPFRPGSVGLVVNLFTSFGYFEHDREHVAALREMIKPLRQGGWFVIDYLNTTQVIATLTSWEETTLGGMPVVIERSLKDGVRFVIKTITTPDGRQFLERVRLYPPAELIAMIEQAGGRVRHQFGDYHGGPPGPDRPRVILFAQAAAC